MKKYAFGVDIGGTTVKIGLFETNGELSQKWEIPTRKEGNGAKILPDIAASLNDKLKELDMVMHDALSPFRKHATALWALGKLAIHRTH